jgi:hypothetical protein
MSRDFMILSFALLFLVMGLAELALFKRVVYPSLRWRYEKAKATMSTGLRPQLILDLVRVQCFFLLPLIGTYLAMRLFPVVN